MLYPESYPSLAFLLRRNIDLAPERTIPEEVLLKFHETLIAHISAVQQAGHDLGLDRLQLEEHDISKFSHIEFNAYARHFQGGGAPKEFATAWLHHLHQNPHHWQHWMFPDGFAPKGSEVENGIMEMPEHYALEMIADWQGASVAYTGSPDMSDWLWKNIPKISLHSKTATFVRATLRELGYGDMLALNFKSEVGIVYSHPQN